MAISIGPALDIASDFLHWQRRLHGIEGYLHDLEGYALLRLAATGPAAGAIVEIGSFLGRSTAFLAAGSKSAGREKVVAVDHFCGSPEHQLGQPYACETLVREGTTFHQFQDNLKRCGLFDYVTPVVASSQQAAMQWDGPIRLLFIDGDHSYEESRADFERWNRFVVPGGVVCFHDVDVWPGVTRFYRELTQDSRYREVAAVRSLRAVEKASMAPAGSTRQPIPMFSIAAPRSPSGSFDVAVVVPTIGRPTLERAIRSIFSQDLVGTIQVLIGVDAWNGDRERLATLAADAPEKCDLFVFDPGYSTSVRHGGFTTAQDGGALRTVLSYAAQSRFVAYLDDDNWWAPDHLSLLMRAVRGHDWAYSLRWFVDPDTGAPLQVDQWESVGPGRGVFAQKFGGFVDPSCLLIDKVACEPALRQWCHPLEGDARGMSADRTMFAWLRARPVAGTGTPTVYYTLGPSDINHQARMQWIASQAKRSQMP